MGVVAVRMVMTETLDEEGKPTLARPAPGSALLPLLGIVGVTVARAFGWIQLNDPLTRGLIFIPLFILLLVRLHKQTLANQAAPAGITGLLSHPALSFLGAISFPIFIVHGALGQLFFKKVVAVKVWGGVLNPQYFPVWIITVLVSATLLHQFFVTVRKRPLAPRSGAMMIWRSREGERMRRSVTLLRFASSGAWFCHPAQNKKVGEVSDKVAKKIVALLG